MVQISPWLLIILLIILVFIPLAFWKIHKKSGFLGLRKWICRIGLICGIILVGCFIVFGFFMGLLGMALTGDFYLGLDILMVALIGGFLFLILNIVVTVFCWNISTRGKWGLVGGILLTIEGLGLIVSMVWTPVFVIRVGILSPLLLASGILFILSWREGRNQLRALTE